MKKSPLLSWKHEHEKVYGLVDENNVVHGIRVASAPPRDELIAKDHVHLTKWVELSVYKRSAVDLMISLAKENTTVEKRAVLMRHYERALFMDVKERLMNESLEKMPAFKALDVAQGDLKKLIEIIEMMLTRAEGN